MADPHCQTTELATFLAERHPAVAAEFYRSTTPNYLEVGVQYCRIDTYTGELLYLGHDETPHGTLHYFQRFVRGAEQGQCIYEQDEVFAKLRRIDESVPFREAKNQLGYTKKVHAFDVDLCVTGSVGRNHDDTVDTLCWTVAPWNHDTAVERSATVRICCYGKDLWLDLYDAGSYNVGPRSELDRARYLAARYVAQGVRPAPLRELSPLTYAQRELAVALSGNVFEQQPEELARFGL